MTVSELIKELADWSPDTEVKVMAITQAVDEDGVELYQQMNAVELTYDDTTSDQCLLIATT